MTFPPLDRTIVVTERERDNRWFFQNLVREIVTGNETGGAFSLAELQGPPGEEVPLHVHTVEDESFLLIEGQITLWAGNETRVLEPGDFGIMPRNVPHCYRVTSDTPARWYAITSPAGFEGFMREASQPAAEQRIPDPVQPTPEQLAELGALAQKYGVTFLGAPGSRPTDLEGWGGAEESQR